MSASRRIPRCVPSSRSSLLHSGASCRQWGTPAPDTRSSSPETASHSASSRYAQTPLSVGTATPVTAPTAPCVRRVQPAGIPTIRCSQTAARAAPGVIASTAIRRHYGRSSSRATPQPVGAREVVDHDADVIHPLDRHELDREESRSEPSRVQSGVRVPVSQATDGADLQWSGQPETRCERHILSYATVVATPILFCASFGDRPTKPRPIPGRPNRNGCPHPRAGGWLYSEGGGCADGLTVGSHGPKTMSASPAPGHGGIVAPIAASDSPPLARN